MIRPWQLEFLRSAFVMESDVSDIADVDTWIEEIRSENEATIRQKPIADLDKWKLDPLSGNLSHITGRFFTIEGITVRTNWGSVAEWDQPIIRQPEVGILGFIVKKIAGQLHFLVQAKIEPGNINLVQLSPTLQATKSNYTQAHMGTKPAFLELFTKTASSHILVDQLQSEQGARFLSKRNRNIIVEIDEDRGIELPTNFRWFTLGQLKKLLRRDNLINMDSRTVLSSISYGTGTQDVADVLKILFFENESDGKLLISALKGDQGYRDFNYILSWITALKTQYELEVRPKGLSAVREWGYYDGEYRRFDGRFFKVIGVSAQVRGREVSAWDQPMVQPTQSGLIAFLLKEIDGVVHFLVQAKLEPGNFDIIELAPTVQCLTGDFRSGKSEYYVPYLEDVLSAPSDAVLFDACQSEEGGRFFQESNRSMLVLVDERFDVSVHGNYCWMTLGQLYRFMEFNNYLNMAARSLISCISFV